MTRTLAVALVLGAFIGACSRAPEEGSEGSSPAPSYVAAVSSLCSLQGSTSSEDARATFFGFAHEGLHELARQLEGVDRRSAARLLEAKARVEEDLALDELPIRFERDVADLARAGGEGVGALGGIPISC